MSVVDRETFTVVRSGRWVKILDASGRAVAKVQPKLAFAMTCQAENNLRILILWRQKLSQMASHFSQRRDRCLQDPWEKKCGVWMSSLRWRRNRTKVARKTGTLDGRVRDSQLGWDGAAGLLLSQYANRFYEKRRRDEMPWRLWAQTVYSNLGKRRDIRNERSERKQVIESRWQSHDQKFDGDRRASRLQVCFDWY